MPESEQGARGRGKAFLGGAIAGLTHAVLMTLAFPALPGLDGVFPPSGLPAIVLFALTPLVVVARRNAAGPKRWLAMGVFAGCLPFPLGQHLWVFAISDLGAPFLVAMLALYPALFTWLFAWCTNRVGPDRLCTLWLGGGVLWGGLEVLRGYVLFDGYPWHFIGQPLIDFLFPAAGALIGLAGVSLLTAMLACSIGLLERSRRSAAVCTYISLNISAFIITSFLGGRYAEPGEDVVRVGVLQTNIPQSVKGTWEIERRCEDFDAFVLATDEMVREWEPDLIVWPETMFPGPSLERSYRDVLEAYVVERGGDPALSWFTGLATSLEQAQGFWEVPMLVGATAAVEPEAVVGESGEIEFFDPKALYNSVFVVQGGAVGDRYDKMHLTPFGEVMPYISAWPWLEKQLLSFAARGKSFELDEAPTGSALEVQLDSGPLGVAAPICFEASNPGVVRRLVVGPDGERAAGLISHATNDGWFGSFDHGRRLHEQLLRWRCVEFGTPGVRAANTGISGAYDASGRPIEPVHDSRSDPTRAFGVAVFDVPVPDGPMPPAAWAERWVRWASLFGFVGVIVAGLVIGRKPRSHAGAGAEDA